MNSQSQKKEQKYQRLLIQLKELFQKVDNPYSRMATICAVLHHKNTHFFWTGFYMISDNAELEVICYQGPLACMRLKKNTGVCWSGINSEKAIIVDDVHSFPGHIACNPLSKSEIVIPLCKGKSIVGVLDIDSDQFAAFDQTDAEMLTKIVNLVYEQ
ncbi:MAG: GAF domain-containing protein [Bacteroidales bacterium]|nr:GAF domain-containing protein [Bacteroidales bacterium]MDD3859836.1 GAF domain-containing protein [Bacteroidales bacterium]